MTHTFIQDPSSKLITHQHKLKTFSAPKVTKNSLKTTEQDKKKVTMCLKKRLQAVADGQVDGNSSQQYLELPRAIADGGGLPNKGTKSTARDFLEARYTTITTPSLPLGWNPECVLFDAIFWLHMKLFHYIQRGTKEIHLVFDTPMGFNNHPKSIEHKYWYNLDSSCPFEDQIKPSDSMKCPKDWNLLMQCQQCKHNLASYIGQKLLQMSPEYLKFNQKVYAAGCEIEGSSERTMYTTCTAMLEPESRLRCNAPKADTRLWLHATYCYGKNTLIVSADTDVVFIGLPTHFPNNTVIIKTNATGKPSKYLYMDKLQDAILRDPDLATIPTSNRAKVLQAVYVLSECDFVSFFTGFGKVAFFKCLLMHSDFIVGQQLLPGDLNENSASESGLQAFVRLIGCLYFTEHRRAFGNSTTPASLFHQLQSPENDSAIQHAEWLDAIRNEVWPRIYFENKLISSLEALRRHYHRAMWVINYWRQAAMNSMDTLPPQYNG